MIKNKTRAYEGSEHGGNIYRFADELNLQENKILDFSASINPLGSPISVIKGIKRHLNSISYYPDPDARAFTKAIAKFYNIDPETVVCGNGSTELIYLVVKALKPNKAFIPIPTFSEYERACKLYGTKIIYYNLRETEKFYINPYKFISSIIALGNIDMLFLCNPNNPTGRLLKKTNVLEIAELARLHQFFLVVDEAFIDFVPNESVITEVGKNPYLIVLRSMTKFFALAGLRLGYGVFPLQVLNIIKQYKEPWTVNTLAQKAGILALKDSMYKQKTFRMIAQEKKFMEASLKKLGIQYIPSSTNYFLLRLSNAKRMVNKLKDAGIMVRDCSNFKGLGKNMYIRIAVKSHKDNVHILKELLK